MGLAPQGVSGNSGGGGSFNFGNINTVVAPGQVYELSRWVGYTLRHLSFSLWIEAYYPIGAIAITKTMPTSLHPRNLNPQALFTVLISPYTGVNIGPLILDFPPGLIWVAPGESLYVVVYDLVHSTPESANTGQWALNMLWEPYSKG
jgi:hypothetical protein